MYRLFFTPPSLQGSDTFFFTPPQPAKIVSPSFFTAVSLQRLPFPPAVHVGARMPPSAAHLCLHGWPTPGTPANLWMRGPLAGAGCCPLGCAGLNLPPCPSLDFSEDDRTTRQGLGLATRCAIPQQFVLTGELVVEGCAINCFVRCKCLGHNCLQSMLSAWLLCWAG